MAGIDNHDNECVVKNDKGKQNGKGNFGTGAVYVYDAIGSYERVAVGSAGTGRELLQPILDRLFSESSKIISDKTIKHEGQDKLNRDEMAVPAEKQRLGVAGSLNPPVETTVNCSWQEAVTYVTRAYLSVSEREISVGDEVVICVVRSSDNEDGGSTVDVLSFPLKKH